jgi:hypothetical protein
MQVAQSGHFGEIGSIEGNRLPSSDAGLDASVYAEPLREEIALLLKPNRDRTRVLCLVAGALLAGIAMGWAGSSTWHSHSTVAALAPMAKPISRQSETKSASNVESIRKPAPVASAPKSQGAATSAMRADAEGAKSAPAFTASIGAPETRTPMAPVPETRPTTIDGWTVLEVRGGSSAVLEGPSGVRTVALGDTVPGIGRIDSIVRWGNRWIVATASGLIATR